MGCVGRCAIAGLVGVVAILVGISVILTGQITHPMWYQCYIHAPGSPAELTDADLPRTQEGHRLHDLNLGYENVVIDSPYERWTNARTGKEESMKLRGWYIGMHHTNALGESNRDRMNKALKSTKSRGPREPQLLEGPAREGVVGIHGAGVDRREMLRHVVRWISNGYEVLVVDYRDHGVSDGHQRGLSYGYREREDVATVLTYANQTLGWDNVVVFGTSQGGASAILGVHELNQRIQNATQKPVIPCMIVENAYGRKDTLWLSAIQKLIRGTRMGASDLSQQSTFTRLIRDYGEFIPDALFHVLIRMVYIQMGFFWDSLEPEEVVQELSEDIRFLYMHGTADSVIDLDHSQRLFDRTKSSQKVFKIFEGGQHAVLTYQFPGLYTELVDNFLQDCRM